MPPATPKHGPAAELLIVEDNPDDEMLVLRALRRANVVNPSYVVRDGVQALDYLFCTGDYAGRDPDLPSLVLLDLKLPKLDGFEVLKRMRADDRTKRVPVVVMTTSDEQQDVVDSYNFGANSYLRKPVSFDEFVEAMRQLGMYWMILNEAPPEVAMADPIHILLVEDDENDALLIERALRRSGFEVDTLRVETEDEMAAALDQGHFDAILADHSLPNFSSLQALGVMKEKNFDGPFIIVSGKIGEDAAVAAMKSGANDYVMKDRLTRLGAALEQALDDFARRREMIRLQGQEEALQGKLQGEHEGLVNRNRELRGLNRLFQDHLAERFAIVDTYRRVLNDLTVGNRLLTQAATAAASADWTTAMAKLDEASTRMNDIVTYAAQQALPELENLPGLGDLDGSTADLRNTPPA